VWTPEAFPSRGAIPPAFSQARSANDNVAGPTIVAACAIVHGIIKRRLAPQLITTG